MAWYHDGVMVARDDDGLVEWMAEQVSEGTEIGEWYGDWYEDEMRERRDSSEYAGRELPTFREWYRVVKDNVDEDELEWRSWAEDIHMSESISRSDLRRLLSECEISGGITDPDGDIVQVRTPDEDTVEIWLDGTYGDDYPEDDEIVRAARKVKMQQDRDFLWIPVEDDGPDEVTCTKALTAQGSSLVIPVTKEARLLGLGRGDAVEVTIRRVRYMCVYTR